MGKWKGTGQDRGGDSCGDTISIYFFSLLFFMDILYLSSITTGLPGWAQLLFFFFRLFYCLGYLISILLSILLKLFLFVYT
jgi:hypothetical protein